MYSLHSVKKAYGSVQAIRGISCQIGASGFTVIMGPSGSGKSTLLRLLSFLEPPDEGSLELTVDAVVYRSELASRPWPTVTCVFQGKFLWPHMSLRQNIELPLRHLSKLDRQQRVQEAVGLFDMDRFIDRFPYEVSGGEAQRASLARALVLRPKVLLIDEAHVGLDLIQQETLNRHLVQLHTSGLRIVTVTHSLSFANRFAHEIVVVEAGRIVDIGGPELLTRPSSAFLKIAVSSEFV